MSETKRSKIPRIMQSQVQLQCFFISLLADELFDFINSINNNIISHLKTILISGIERSAHT